MCGREVGQEDVNVTLFRVARVVIGLDGPGGKLEIGPSVGPLFNCVQDADLPALLAQDVAPRFSLAVIVECAVIMAKGMNDNSGFPVRKSLGTRTQPGGGRAQPYADEESGYER